jgi:hypothetical protein
VDAASDVDVDVEAVTTCGLWSSACAPQPMAAKPWTIATVSQR